MRLLRRRPPAVIFCDRPRCDRRAVVAASSGMNQHTSVCASHVVALEHLWGQVMTKGI